MKYFDTIAAIATGLGENGISIIRISGSNALKILMNIFIDKKHEKITAFKSYTMKYGFIVDSEGELIDEVIVSYMKGPRSYTAEDVVEVNCHGGIISTNKILEEIIKSGSRLAEPGEFTKRAFLNGRIDLSQAEAVMDIIQAKTEVSMKSAMAQAEGVLSEKITTMRNRILEVIANIEATVDYPEEDLEEITSERGSEWLKVMVEELASLLNSAKEGKIIREGLNTVIVGKPNVGKSSLLNALLMENRAIVTEIAGTTRDVIEEYINMGGIPVKIVDTAGIRETDDLVEQIGVKKSIEKIEAADLIILMLDSSRALDDEDMEIIKYIEDKKYIVLLNKSDLKAEINNSDLKSLNAKYMINISAKTGFNIEALKSAIVELFFSGEVAFKNIMITNSRHRDAILRAKLSCDAGLLALKNTGAIDMATIDIKSAWSALGEITGDTLSEDIIDKIFSKFCIGK